MQTEEEGLTGSIAFDQDGLRSGYQLEVLDTNYERGLAKVRHKHWVNTEVAC